MLLPTLKNTTRLDHLTKGTRYPFAEFLALGTGFPMIGVRILIELVLYDIGGENQHDKEDEKLQNTLLWCYVKYPNINIIWGFSSCLITNLLLNA